MAQEAEMLHGTVSADVVIENVEYAKKSNDTERRDKPSANPAAFPLGISNLREADAHGQRNGIEEIALESQQSLPESKLLREVHVSSDEVKQGVAEAGGSEGGSEQAQTRPGFEITHKRGVEEEIDEEFLVIVVVTIPKFRDGVRLEGTIGVSQSKETGHATDGNVLVAKAGEPEKLFKES